MLGIFVVFFYFGIVGRYVTEPFNRNSPATCSECSNSQEISESSDLLLSQRDKRQYKYYLKDRTNIISKTGQMQPMSVFVILEKK